MGERLIAVAVWITALGCGESSAARGSSNAGRPAPEGGAGAIGVAGGRPGTGASGGAGAGASGSGGLTPDETRDWTWEPCGAIPSTEEPFDERYEVGSAVDGGHPRLAGNAGDVTGLAMSADGLTLVSMGGVTLVWDVAQDFSASRATYVHRARPEWPRVDISPDGRWIAISGDGRVVISRSGLQGINFASWSEAPEPCFPIELRFSPDGEWLAGAGWTGAIDVFRMADLEAAATDTAALEPSASLPSRCGPASASSDVRAPMRSAFTPDARTLVTEGGARYLVGGWRELAPGVDLPAPHGLRGGFEVSSTGMLLVSDCDYGFDTNTYECRPYQAPFPKFSPEGHWIVAGATLLHVASGDTRVLDPTALVGIFAPNGDVIAAGADNSLTRYCKIE